MLRLLKKSCLVAAAALPLAMPLTAGAAEDSAPAFDATARNPFAAGDRYPLPPLPPDPGPVPGYETDRREDDRDLDDADNVGLNHEALRVMLQGLGYPVEVLTNPDGLPTCVVAAERDGVPFRVEVTVSNTGRYVWLHTSLASIADPANVSKEFFVDLLRKAADTGTASVYIDANWQVRVAMPVSSAGFDGEMLKLALDDFGVYAVAVDAIVRAEAERERLQQGPQYPELPRYPEVPQYPEAPRYPQPPSTPTYPDGPVGGGAAMDPWNDPELVFGGDDVDYFVPRYGGGYGTGFGAGNGTGFDDDDRCDPDFGYNGTPEEAEAEIDAWLGDVEPQEGE